MIIPAVSKLTKHLIYLLTTKSYSFGSITNWFKKIYCWIWIAINRLGKRFISFICGNRSTQTGHKVWEEIKDIPVSFYCSDYYKNYKAFIPNELPVLI
jgi:IS1 family transposase